MGDKAKLKKITDQLTDIYGQLHLKAGLEQLEAFKDSASSYVTISAFSRLADSVAEKVDNRELEAFFAAQKGFGEEIADQAR